MKRLIALSAMLLASSAVYAADMSVAPLYKAAPATLAAPTWTGMYIGVDGGLNFNGSFDVTTSPGASNTQTSNSGWAFGGHLGYDYQMGHVVLGLETDISGSTESATSTAGVKTTLPWYGTARAKVGYLPTPSLMLYGTGGAAYGEATITGGPTTINLPGVGWSAGVGAEYALLPSVRVRAEYLHIDLYGPSATSGPFSLTTRATSNVGRMGLSYAF
jgi:outer membrane immunogenic protein